jgi:hypothetical protein
LRENIGVKNDNEWSFKNKQRTIKIKEE